MKLKKILLLQQFLTDKFQLIKTSSISKGVLFIVLCFFSGMYTIKAQSIVINGVTGTPVCAGSQITITFSAQNGNGSNRYDNSSSFNLYLSNSTGTGFTNVLTFQATAVVFSTVNGGITSNITKTLTIPANTPAGIGYRVSIGSVNPNYNNSSPYNLNQSSPFTVNARPTGIISGTTTICNGSSANLSLAVTGSGTISGTLSNGTTFSGTAPLITVAVSPSTTITYTIATLSNGICSAIASDKTGTATVTVNTRPTAVISGSTTICNGSTATLSLAVTGSGTLSGTLSNGTAFSGTAPLITVVVNPSITTVYNIATLTNGTCSSIAADLTGSATVTVKQKATISSQPAVSQTICSSTSVSFSVTVTGTGPFSYQWYKGATLLNNGGSLSGTNSSILTINPVFVSDAGTDYYVMITEPGPCAALLSNNATLIVNQEIFFTVQPQASQTVCEGSIANITATATGSGPFTAQWYKGATQINSGISTISDATSVSSTLTLNPVSIADAGSDYFVVISSATSTCSSEYSDNAGIIVQKKSADPVTASASSSLICAGQNTTLSLNGGGGGTTESIKWYTSSCGGTLAGSGNNLLVAPSVTTTYFGRYENSAPCNYNSACQEVTVTVNQKSTNPVSASASVTTICNGQSSILTLTGGGAGTGEVIRWYSTSCGVTLVGSGNGLSVSPLTTTTYYGRYETAAPCSFNSACVPVTINVIQPSTAPLSANATPATICNGSNSTLAISGGVMSPGAVIRWYTASCGGTLAGIGNNFSVSPTATTTYFGRYEDPAPCNMNTACVQVTVTVNQKSGNPSNASASPTIICNGQSTVLSLNGGGGGNLEQVKWYTTSCGGTLVGTANNLSVSPLATTTYYGRYENGAPCSYSTACASVTVTVNQKSTSPVSVTASPAAICIGGSSILTLNGGVTGPGAIIRWYTTSCGGTLAGTGNNLSVNPISTTTYFGRYEDPAPCNVNTACAQVTLTVNQLATANAGSDISFCGDPSQATPTGAVSIDITAGATASNNSGVLWSSSGNGTFTNANSLTLAAYTPSAADKTAGSVILTLTANGIAPCANATSTKTLFIGKPIVNVVKLNSTCGAGNTAIVQIGQGSPAISGGDGIFSYQWEFSSPGNSNFLPIAGETNANLSTVQQNNNGFFRRVVTSGGCTSYSNRIHVNASFVINATSFTVTGGGSFCSTSGIGVPVGLSGSIDGMPEFYVTYRLFRNGINTGVSINGTGAALNFPNQNIPGTYTVDAIVTAVGGNSCSSQLITGNVVVTEDAAVPVVNAGVDQALCNATTTTLTGSNPSPYTGTWSRVSGTGTINSPGSQSTTISGLSIGDNVFKWKVKNNTCADSANVTIHVEPALTISSQPAETTFCEGGSTSMTASATGAIVNYQWMVSADNGLTWAPVSNNAITSGSNTNTLTFNGIPLALSGNLYKVIATVPAPCNSNKESNAVSLLVKNLWTGTADNNWFTNNNWSDKIVPDMTCPDVYIQGGRPNQPTIGSGIVSVRNITIYPGAVLTLNNANLKVSGAINNSGSVNASNGSVEFNGTSNQAIAANTFQNNALKNLTINTNGTLTLNGALDVYGNISFTGTGKTLVTNNNLTLKSTASGTASVNEIPVNGSGVALDFITGNVTVERFIPAYKAWRFLSVPTNTIQSIKQTWQENQIANSTSLSGFGIHITSNRASWAADGFDLGTPAGSSIKIFNSATSGWSEVTSAYNPINTNQGYMTLIRGDRTVNQFNQPATTTILRTNGPLYTGKQPVINVAANQFFVVGNPFASAIDFSQVSKSGGVQDNFYVWDPKLAAGYGLGGYQTFVGPGPDYTVIPGGGSYASGNTAIESGQAILVRAVSNPGTVTILESSKTGGSNLVTRQSNQAEHLRVGLNVISNGNKILLDGVLSQFDPAYSNAVDEMDVAKLFNQTENMSILSQGQILIAEKKSGINPGDTIFYHISQLQKKEYELEINSIGIDKPGIYAVLEDAYLNTSTIVNPGGITINKFLVNNDPLSAASSRFRIVFKQAVVLPVTFSKISANRNADNSVKINWQSENETSMSVYEVERSIDGRTFIKIGSTPALLNNGGNFTYQMDDIHAGKDEIFYRVKGLGLSGQKQYSAIVKVTALKTASDIRILSNPVVNKIINIYFENQKAGTYNLRLLASNGQVLLKTFIKLNNSNETHTVNAEKIAAGTYVLEITSAEGNQLTRKLLIQ